MIQRLAVYCGSAPGVDPGFADAARLLGLTMVERGIDLPAFRSLALAVPAGGLGVDGNGSRVHRFP